MNGKGDKPRPLAVPYSRYADNYDQIDWGKKTIEKKSKKDKHMEAVNWSQMLGELPEDYNKDKEASSLINPSNSIE
jgi:hypothetical protein